MPLIVYIIVLLVVCIAIVSIISSNSQPTPQLQQIYINKTGEEILKEFGIKNGVGMPGIASSIQIDYSVDVEVMVDLYKFIAVFDIDSKKNKNFIGRSNYIEIVFTEDFLQKPLGLVNKNDLSPILFIERVILNPHNIESMTLYTQQALSY